MIDKLTFLKKKIFLSKYEKEFIIFNKNLYQNNRNNSNEQILVELFEHPPLIYFWSIIVNYISKKNKLKIKYFYFKTYNSLISKFIFFIKNLSKVYNSFNVSEGINEYNFPLFRKKEFAFSEFNKIKTKKQLEEFRYKGIKIGDLIYDTYIRTTFNPSVNLEDDKLFNIFCRAIHIFDNVENYLKKNIVKLLITSHSYYIQYGIILRIGIKNNIPVMMVHNKARGNTEFRLKIVDKKYPFEHNYGYLNYNKDFKKLKNKSDLIKIGKKLIEERIYGHKKLSYLKHSPYKKNKISKKIFFKDTNKKENIIIFAHCFFDAVHRYRYSIFEDYFEQIIFFMELSENDKKYNWFIKQHPNDLPYNDVVYKEKFSKYKKINFLDKNTSNTEIIKLNPKIAITNNGSITHEFSYFKIPVINTGDNCHINYNFCLHPKTKKELADMIYQIEKYKNKINFDPKNIYEFMYMHYAHQVLKNNENKFLKDRYFATKNINFNSTVNIFKYYKNNHKKNIFFINEYIKIFLGNNFKSLNLNF